MESLPVETRSSFAEIAVPINGAYRSSVMIVAIRMARAFHPNATDSPANPRSVAASELY
jgi:hypothetical protein